MLKLPSGELTTLPSIKFPTPIEREAKKAVFRDELFRNRQEVRGFTIDDIDSPDLDDAIWLEKIQEGWVIQVSISDVDALVKKESYLDFEAVSRVQTHYFPTRVVQEKLMPKHCIPMLPRVLSENRLSLRQGVIRPTMTVDVRLSERLDFLGVRIFKSYLRSIRRLGLREYGATRVIGDPGLPLWDYFQLAKALNQKRWTDGQSIAFQELKEGVHTDEEGMAHQGSVSAANLIVQEFMILANYAVGHVLQENRRLAPFRNHRPARNSAPTREQITAEIDRTSDYLTLVDNLRTTYNKFLGAAEYEPRAAGHFGIGLPVYLHFTSPIRRYADLVAHRVVKALIDGERPPYSRADMIELCRYLNKRIRRQATLRTIQAGTHSQHNYMRFGHLLTKETNGHIDYVDRLLAYLKENRIGNAFFEFTASDGYTITLSCVAKVRYQRVLHQVRFDARADKLTVKNEAARLLLKKIRALAQSCAEAGIIGGNQLTSEKKLPEHLKNNSEKENSQSAQLYRYCEFNDIAIPTFHYEIWTGGEVIVRCICQISETLVMEGHGQTRETARQKAAGQMLKYLKSGQHISRQSFHPPAPPENEV